MTQRETCFRQWRRHTGNYYPMTSLYECLHEHMDMLVSSIRQQHAWWPDAGGLEKCDGDSRSQPLQSTTNRHYEISGRVHGSIAYWRGQWRIGVECSSIGYQQAQCLAVSSQLFFCESWMENGNVIRSISQVRDVTLKELLFVIRINDNTDRSRL